MSKSVVQRGQEIRNSDIHSKTASGFNDVLHCFNRVLPISVWPKPKTAAGRLGRSWALENFEQIACWITLSMNVGNAPVDVTANRFIISQHA